MSSSRRPRTASNYPPLLNEDVTKDMSDKQPTESPEASPRKSRPAKGKGKATSPNGGKEMSDADRVAFQALHRSAPAMTNQTMTMFGWAQLEGTVQQTTLLGLGVKLLAARAKAEITGEPLSSHIDVAQVDAIQVKADEILAAMREEERRLTTHSPRTHALRLWQRILDSGLFKSSVAALDKVGDKVASTFTRPSPPPSPAGRNADAGPSKPAKAHKRRRQSDEWVRIEQSQEVKKVGWFWESTRVARCARSSKSGRNGPAVPLSGTLHGQSDATKEGSKPE
ncbi:hypothetical protein BDZ90DRAFT_261793 [Jaminaea rosea]|uniref:Uncharacterized protein n=1 Tax=Jaminaea rosea TaxID=1569628 RepID=A0A316UQ61_9BASI|nr:hypothetical protein BDZ90DRAFT_261793 [Jaminaea rosea]PWN26013.1 hypothetical protein BDZ90DRAFT_261793 [Jaminaea rosea]